MNIYNINSLTVILIYFLFQNVYCQVTEEELIRFNELEIPETPIFINASELKWINAFEGFGVKFASVFGDTFTSAHGTFAKFPPGFITPEHIHSHSYKAVVISGIIINPMNGERNEEAKRMGAGSYWSVPGNEVHTTGCISDEPCIFYMYQPVAFDFIATEKD